MINRMTQGGTSSAWIAATADCGMPLTVSSQENTPAPATMISTWAVRYIELTETSQIPRQEMSPYMNLVTMIA